MICFFPGLRQSGLDFNAKREVRSPSIETPIESQDFGRSLLPALTDLRSGASAAGIAPMFASKLRRIGSWGLLLGVTATGAFGTCSAQIRAVVANADQAEPGSPAVHLRTLERVHSHYVGAQLSNSAQALTMAAGDFDGDGVPDLISGFATSGGGSISVHRGNIDALWPYGAALRNGTPAAFLPEVRVFSIPQAPDFLLTGDFDADGHLDVVTAQRGSSALYFLRGDGHGGFAAAQRVAVAGSVTAMIAGEINRADGLADLVVSVDTASGPRALVFESPSGALKASPEMFSLPASATALALGHFDGGAMNDLAVATGNQIVTVHGRDRRLSSNAAESAAVPAAKVTAQNFSFGIRALTEGNFSASGPSMAALGSDGSVHVLAHAITQANPGSSTSQPTMQINGRGPNAKPQIVGGTITPNVSATLSTLRQAARSNSNVPEWTEQSTVALPSGFRQTSPLLVKGRLSGSLQEDILAVDSGNAKVHVLSTGLSSTQVNARAKTSDGTSASSVPMRVLTSVDATNSPAAVLPMRLNQHGLSSLVILQAGQTEPTVAPRDVPPANVFTVTNTLDITSSSTSATIPAGSLRRAMKDANSATGNSSIVFNIPTSDPGYNPATGVFTIKPLSENVPGSLDAFALPPIDGTMTIDGYTQPGASPNTLTNGDNARILIQIDGSLVTTPGGSGFVPFDSVGTIIRGFDITGFTLAQIASGPSGGTASGAEGVEANGIGDFIEGNFIGVDATGKTAMPNRIGIFADNGPAFGNTGGGNIVGGTTPQARNLVSGNSLSGVLFLSSAYQSQLQGNFIGTDATGTAAIPNGSTGTGGNGPLVTYGGTTPGAGNLISGNPTNMDFNDLTNGGQAGNSLFQGNLVGTDATGTKSLSSASTGVSILHNVKGETIGGTSPGARNIISGNTVGIYVFDASTSNVIQGNYIGLDVTGTKAVGNTAQGYNSGATSSTGVAATDNIIGGAVRGAGNVISGNGADGIQIAGTSGGPNSNTQYHGNTIQGNVIGADVTGTAAIPNAGSGIHLITGATNNVIGGTNPGAGNLIANNTGSGVLIDPGTPSGGMGTGNATIANTILSNGGAGVRVQTGTGSRISQNSIYANAALGIDVDAAGPTANSHCNATNIGANNLQNAPVLTGGSGSMFISATATDPNGNTSEFSSAVKASLNGNILSLLGNFDSTANTAYTIEFFASPTADPSGFGQGQTYLGSTSVTTGAGCTAAISDPVDTTQADMSVTLRLNTTEPEVGPDFGFQTYTSVVTNNGVAIAHNVTYTDALPTGLVISSAYCNVGSCQSPVVTSSGTCTVSGQTITCNLGTMAPGATATITFPVQYLASGSIVNTATVSATEADPNTANNTAASTASVSVPYPALDHLDPATALVNSPDLPMTIYGNGLLSSSTVTFNGNPLTVTGVLDNQVCGGSFQPSFCTGLQVVVPASMLTTAGTPTVAVSNAGSGSGSQTFTIAATCTYSPFSSLGSTIDPDGSSLIPDSVDVSTNVSSCPWTATSTVPWAVILDNASATGNANVDLAFAPNAGTTSRSGSVTVAGQTYSFTQGPNASCTESFSPTTQSFTSAGGSGSIAVTSNCFGYFVNSFASWITISQNSGLLSDNGTASFTVAPNAGAARSGSILIGGTVLTITQEAPSCYFTLNSSAATFPVNGGSGSIAVTASSPSCAYAATSSDASHLTVTSGASGTGSGTVSYTVPPNTGGAQTPTITIGSTTASSIFTETQVSAYTCTFTLSPNTRSVSSSGATSFVEIDASFSFCKWTASSNSDGITVTENSSGTGTGSFLFAVAKNTGAPRTLTITAGCQTLTVNQDGQTAVNPAPAITTLLPATASAGSGAFTLTVSGSNFVSGAVVNFNGVARATTFVSATQLTAAILASDVAVVGTPSVSVTNPTPDGSTSNTLTFTITTANTTTPIITSLSPATTAAGSPAFTLTVNGSNFVSGSVVNFGGSARTTTFVSSSQLTAAIPATDVVTPGTAPVSVTNPAPGGGTAAPVTFTITAASAPQATLTPATITFANTTVGTTANAQTISLKNSGGAVLTITGITIGGPNPTAFSQTNTCGASLAAGANCTISVVFTPVSAASFAATLSVTDNAAGSPQTASLSGTGTAASTPVPSFTVASSTAAQTIQPGGVATYTITVTAQNGTISTPVTLSASGLPPGATATFAPSSVTPGSTSATSQLSIQTSTTQASAASRSSGWQLAGPALPLLGLLFTGRRRRRRWITLALLMFSTLGTLTVLIGCGGGFGSPIGGSKSYAVTVTATSGAVQQTTTVQLTIN